MTEREYVLGYIQVGEPDTEAAEECPACGFDALLTFPCVLISARGVTRWAPVRACVRCWEESHPDE